MSLKRFVAVVCLVVFISACGLFSGKDDLAYKKAKAEKPLIIPEGLTQPEGVQRLDIPSAENEISVSPEELERPPEIVKSVDLSELESEAKGTKSETKTAQPATPKGVTSTLTHNDDGASLLLVDAEFDQVWTLVGPALKELGFTIDDSNKGAQVYTISKTLPVVRIDDKPVHPGDEKPDVKEEYQIHLESEDDKTQVAVHNKFGKLEGSGLSEHLLLQIKEIIANPKATNPAKG